MKKTLSLFLAILVFVFILALSGCSSEKAKVESVLEVDSDFAGHRTITLKYPLDVHIEELEKSLLSINPLKDSEKSTFEYNGVGQDGYIFVMELNFSSYDEYVSQISGLVGREVYSYLSQPQTVLTTGTRMIEDFDVSELVSWITKCAQNIEATKDIEYDFSFNTVSINGSVFNTGSTVDISQREGKPINSITVETTNLKDGTYDRTITFSIPNKTYIDLSGSLESYFTANTNPEAQYCDWTSQGSNWEYKVIYKSLTIEELSQYTAKLLDTKSDIVFYGDKDNSSTPLSEGLVFEENFDTFSFMGESGESVELLYKYALPTKTTHGDGSVFDNGKWSTVGAWQDGIYSVSVEKDTMNIRIPDGIQYAINGINFDLEVLGDNHFIRRTDFLYSKTQGIDGMLYAKEFFESKGATVETDEDDDNLICRVFCEGDDATITDQLVKYFGSGNFMAYEVKNPAMALSAKTKLTDYVSLQHMLNSTNANRPITYTVHSSGDENIIDLSCENVDSDKSSQDTDVLLVEVQGGQGTVVYNGNIPNTKNIIIYCIVGVFMFSACVVAIVYMLYRQRKRKHSGNDNSTAIPQQTTTFSIAELTALSDKADKELLEEIDKDINEKIEADRIESLSKELKAKEIEELSKMIYGSPEKKPFKEACDEVDEAESEQESYDESFEKENQTQEDNI
ncbi:MAG: hypothetical protein E7513_07485 [Ruminococcaceae bacterium]|nr:hypothetical protein [Oscillospiraceae bacterium]